jgi:hypothetical protein
MISEEAYAEFDRLKKGVYNLPESPIKKEWERKVMRLGILIAMNELLGR